MILDTYSKKDHNPWLLASHSKAYSSFGQIETVKTLQCSSDSQDSHHKQLLFSLCTPLFSFHHSSMDLSSFDLYIRLWAVTLQAFYTCLTNHNAAFLCLWWIWGSQWCFLYDCLCHIYKYIFFTAESMI